MVYQPFDPDKCSCSNCGALLRLTDGVCRSCSAQPEGFSKEELKLLERLPAYRLPGLDRSDGIN